MNTLFALILVVVLIITGIAVAAFLAWRKVLRFAKGIERGLKMVPILIDLPPASDDADIGGRDERDVIQEKISQAEIVYSLIAGTAKLGFKSNFYGQRHIAFEIVAAGGTIRFFAGVPIALVDVIKQAVLTAYPGAALEEVEEHNIFSRTGKLEGTAGGEVALKEDYAYPIATYNMLKRDALTSIINVFSALEPGEGAALQILLRPAHSMWGSHVESIAKQLRNKKDKVKMFFGIRQILEAPLHPPEIKEEKKEAEPMTPTEETLVEAMEEKSRHPGFETLIRIVASTENPTRSASIIENMNASFALFDAQKMNGFKYSGAEDIEEFVTAFLFRFFPPEKNKMILNSVELATMFHFPDDQFIHTSQVQRQASKQVDGPNNILPSGVMLGYNIYRGNRRPIRLGFNDRRRHTYIVGQTGTGKSVLLENMAVQDMLAGEGFAFIDPHGDTAEALLTKVPKERAEDVIYFNPGDLAQPFGLNLFEHQTPEQRDFIIQETIEMLYKLYDPQHQGIIGPRYEHWFRNAALTVMADPEGGTFIEIPKVFTDKQYQRGKMKYVKDPTVLDFWNKEMAQTSDYHKSEVLGWFVSKFGAFMSNEMMRNTIGQVKSSIELRDVMDSGKILIVNLSKGKVGELNSKLLGMIFVMKFQAAAMSRANVPEDERRDFSLYVDEFQNFSTESFATILSEARKYHLNLIVANQYIGQLTDEIRDAVFGNVGTIISLRSSPADSELLIKQFEPTFRTSDLVKLPNFNAITRLMVNDSPSQPFSMATIPPVGIISREMGEALKKLSAAKYTRPRDIIDREIMDRLEAEPPAIQPAPGQASPSRLPGASGSSFLDEWLAKRRRGGTGGAGGSTPPRFSPPSSTGRAPSTGFPPPNAGFTPSQTTMPPTAPPTFTPASEPPQQPQPQDNQQPGEQPFEADQQHSLRNPPA